MRSAKIIFVLGVAIILSLSLSAQIQTLILQPGPSDGKDALIRDDFPTTNYGDDVNYTSNAWTVGGNPCILRSLIFFDLSAIPANATIISAKLSLYCNLLSGIYQLQYGDNESYLLRIIEEWDEHMVTWLNQPSTTINSKVLIPSSTSQTQDYPDLDVTAPVREMVSDPDSDFGWMIQLVTEQLYRSMVFASSDNSDTALRPELVIEYLSCPGPEAHFNYQVDVPRVSFYDSSTSAASWFWDFGDGYYSDLQHPVHEYSHPGKYFVCLNIEDSCGTGEYCDTVYVCDSPGTKFQYSVNDHFVSFTDLSDTAGSWFWSFGDGFYADIKNPLHYYYNFGTYYVCLTAGNDCFQHTWCDTVEVKPEGIDNKIKNLYKLYPDPAHDYIIVSASMKYPELPERIEIIDQLGTVRRSETRQSQHDFWKIDISGLPPGLYFMRCISGRVVITGSFVIY